MAGPLGYSGGNFAVAPIEVTLAGAQAFLIPSGQYRVDLGKYTTIEWYDKNAQMWREAANLAGGQPFDSDGTNYRLINRTGTPVGAIITNFGSSYTSTPTVTVSAGDSTWSATVGGALNTTVTVTSAGTYTYIPTILFPPPAAGGITATATAVLGGGGISSVTVVNRGAGYTQAPSGCIAVTAAQAQNYLGANQGNNVLVIQDPRDTSAGGAVLTVNSTLATNSGGVLDVRCTDPGTGVLTSLPTLSFSGGGGGGAAATVIMNWAATGFTVSANGSSYGNTTPFLVIGGGLKNASTDATGDVNPERNLNLTKPRNFQFEGSTSSTGNILPSASVGSFDDQGWGIQRVPDGIIIGGGGVPNTIGAVTVTVGAVSDTSYLQMLKV